MTKYFLVVLCATLRKIVYFYGDNRLSKRMIIYVFTVASCGNILLVIRYNDSFVLLSLVYWHI
jgi:hypothetical protein